MSPVCFEIRPDPRRGYGYEERHIAELARECNGYPEATEILTAGGTGAYVRKFVIFNRPLCFVVSTEGDLNIIFITSRFLEVGALW